MKEIKFHISENSLDYLDLMNKKRKDIEELINDLKFLDIDLINSIELEKSQNTKPRTKTYFYVEDDIYELFMKLKGKNSDYNSHRVERLLFFYLHHKTISLKSNDPNKVLKLINLNENSISYINNIQFYYKLKLGFKIELNQILEAIGKEDLEEINKVKFEDIKGNLTFRTKISIPKTSFEKLNNVEFEGRRDYFENKVEKYLLFYMKKYCI